MRRGLAVLMLGVAVAVTASTAFAHDYRDVPPAEQSSVRTGTAAQAANTVVHRTSPCTPPCRRSADLVAARAVYPICYMDSSREYLVALWSS